MLDLHTHIMPDVDDGSRDFYTTLKMLKNAVDEGIDHLVVTPHFKKNVFDNSLEFIQKRFEELQDFIKENNINIKLYKGQEVFIKENTLESFENGEIGTINNGRYMLVEFSLKELPERSLDILYELKINGIIPIIAHPERYKFVYEDIRCLNQFIEDGCLFQLNSGSITGYFGKKVKKVAHKLVEDGLYSFIGSDAHNDNSRNTNLNQALKEVYKKNPKLEQIFKDNEEKFLDNKVIYYTGKKLNKKKFFTSW